MIAACPAVPRRGGHLIVCGDGPLSYRITSELTSRYGERVAVILPSRERNHGPQISALPRVTVLEHAELSTQALVFAVLLAVIGVGFALLATRYSVSNTLYLGVMDLTGSAVTGSKVAGQLHDLGFDVICVDHRPDALGIPLARELGLRVVIGDAAREEMLRSADLETCLALVSVTSQDIVNLETALHARALRDDLRIVIRLTDDDLAERLQKTTGNIISRSVPYLAAPAFAAAMLENQVLRTIAEDRHVLLIADVRVADQAGLAGSFIADTEEDGQARVLALGVGGAALDWSPHRGHLLADGDRLIVLATRTGLGPFLSVH